MPDERAIVDGWLRHVRPLRDATDGYRAPAVMVAEEVERLRARVAELEEEIADYWWRYSATHPARVQTVNKPENE